LVSGPLVAATRDKQPIGSHLGVESPAGHVDHGTAVRLVRALVVAEPDVTMRTEDLPSAELRLSRATPEHRGANLIVVDCLVVAPEAFESSAASAS
jgi:hypothetical protein